MRGRGLCFSVSPSGDTWHVANHWGPIQGPASRAGGGWSAAAFARRRSTRAPEPIQPPVVPEDKISAASSTSSLISIRYRRCPVGREGLGGGVRRAATVTPLLRGGPAAKGFLMKKMGFGEWEICYPGWSLSLEQKIALTERVPNGETEARGGEKGLYTDAGISCPHGDRSERHPVLARSKCLYSKSGGGGQSQPPQPGLPP